MKSPRLLKPRFVFAILLAFILVISLVNSASANVRLQGGGDLPFYARTDPPLPHTTEWGAIIFYRPPDCIPPDFNLLSFFDPAAFACQPYTTDGFAIWKNGPETDPAPVQSKLFGLGAVPVWFVSWPALEGATADGVLTIGELESLSPLIGSASFYEETLHPSGGNHPSMIESVARGTLADGRSFEMITNSTDAKIGVDTRIFFK